MSELERRLHDDLTTAMKARDELTVATLRLALAATKVESVSGDDARELSEDEVTAVLAREAKKRRESAQAYADAGRTDLSDREEAELGVLARYLPEPLTDAELAGLVAGAVATAKADGHEGMRAMGVVMKALGPQVAGRADGAVVAGAVKAALQTG